MMIRLLLTLIVMIFAMPAYAQEGETSLKIAVVNVERLMNESKAAKSIADQGKDIGKKYQKEAAKLGKDLKESEEDLIEASKGDDKDAFLKQRENFQKDLGKSEQKMQELRLNNDKAIAKALNTLSEEINDIVEDMTDENGYDLVVTGNNVFYASEDLDITDAIMKKLNKNLPSVKVRD